MAPRASWKGYLKLSLVSCPIALYTATSSGERVAFRQINKKTGNRLRQQLVDEGTGGLCHVAVWRTRSVGASGFVRPLRLRSATCSSPQREARGAFGLK